MTELLHLKPDLSEIMPRLIRYRKLQGMSVEAASEIMGHAYHTVWTLEAGRTVHPRLDIVWSYAEAIGGIPAFTIALPDLREL